jgi:hypothetical protein
VLLVLLGGWLWSRWRQPAAPPEDDLDDGEATVLMETDLAPAQSGLAQEQPIEIAPPTPPVIAAPGARARLGRRARHPPRGEHRAAAPALHRGALPRDPQRRDRPRRSGLGREGRAPLLRGRCDSQAVELLSFAIEDRPSQIRPWLALFEIYRLERLSGEYADLAGRFAERYAATEQWPKVRAFGREIDPSNPLYQEAPVKSLETIGPREARRMAAVDPMRRTGSRPRWTSRTRCSPRSCAARS